jgi:hypothetical protein
VIDPSDVVALVFWVAVAAFVASRRPWDKSVRQLAQPQQPIDFTRRA